MSRTLFWCAILFYNFNSGNCSRITFLNGRYNGILLAIHPQTDEKLCSYIIGNATELLNEVGSQLYNATNGEALFGSVDILLPENWTLDNCKLKESAIGEAKLHDSYEAADFRFSLFHPIAKTLPWTKQYRGCGSESETVYLPLRFLENSAFSLETKAKIVLFEWTKFRYGVYEEFGFFDDPFFSPCYVRGRNIFYTSCTDNQIDGFDDSSFGLGDCRALLSNSSDVLVGQLAQANSSLLFAPQFDNVHRFCTNTTHNALTPTKQNVFCERKSVADVIYSHKDFKLDSNDDIFPNNRFRRPISSPQINTIQHSQTKKPGYVFIIEDTPNIRELGRLDHVKQAIAEMIYFANDKTGVALHRYNGRVNWPITASSTIDLRTESNRIVFLRKVPSHATSMPVYFGRSTRTYIARETHLDALLRDVLSALELHVNIKWNLILIASMEPVNVAGAVDLMSKSEYSLSILTFNASKDWLPFNALPNLRKLIYLPHCFMESKVCYGKTSSIAADHLIQLVAEAESPRRFIHKVIDININNLTGTFRIDQLVQNGLNFSIHFPIYNDATALVIKSPPPFAMFCTATRMLGYSRMLEILGSGDCSYRTGDWGYVIQGHPPNDPINYNLRGYIETVNTPQDLMIHTEMSQKLEDQVFPNRNRLSAFVSVQTRNEQPVLGASVELEMSYEGIPFNYANVTILKDNGLYPDLTANDGVYSAFVTAFNPNASYHTAQIRTTTAPDRSRSIKSLRSDTFEAALLDSRMTSKCCGSKVPVGETEAIGYSFYTHTLSSFLTGENITFGSDIIPPSKIHTPITIIEDKKDYVKIEFTAPGSDDYIGRVDHYRICCTNSTSSGLLDGSFCEMIPPDSCSPVESNSSQSCQIFRSDLANAFVNGTIQSSGVMLYCGIRGVDDAENSGSISSFLVDILITNEPLQSRVTSCTSLSDGCLPGDILYVLISCIVGLLLILVLIFIYFLFRRRSKSLTKKKLEDKNRILFISGNNHRRSSSPAVAVRNVYINQAFVQDTNGDPRLVASESQLCPLTTGVSEISLEKVRRRSVSVPDVGPIDTFGPSDRASSSTLKHVSWNTRSPVPRVRFNAIPPIASTTRLSSEIPLVQSNPQLQYFLSSPCTTKQSDTQGSDKPLYASVQRFGRKTNKAPNIPILESTPTMNRNTSTFSSSSSLQSGRSSQVRSGDASVKPIRISKADISQPIITKIEPTGSGLEPDSETKRVTSHMLPMLPIVPPVPPPPPQFILASSNPDINGKSVTENNGIKNSELNRPNTTPPPPPPPPSPPLPTPPPIPAEEFVADDKDLDFESDTDSDKW